MPPMRSIAITTILLGSVVLAQDATRFADESAHNLFMRSRAAVVQAGTVLQLRSLIMKGDLRSFTDDGVLLEGRVEIRALLPDHFLRIETYGTSQRVSGFAGNVLLTEMRDGNRIELPPEKLVSQLLRVVHAHFTRLMLGAVTYIAADQQLTFRSSGGTTAMVDPRDSARAAIGDGVFRSAAGAAVLNNQTPEPFALDVTSTTFGARFEVDSQTRMPTLLTFQGAGKEPTTMKFEDRRVVSGLNLPYRITTSVHARPLETIVFDEIQVNPELTRANFRADPKYRARSRA
jgi:hypothetical protein